MISKQDSAGNALPKPISKASPIKLMQSAPPIYLARSAVDGGGSGVNEGLIYAFPIARTQRRRERTKEIPLSDSKGGEESLGLGCVETIYEADQAKESARAIQRPLNFGNRPSKQEGADFDRTRSSVNKAEGLQPSSLDNFIGSQG